MIKDFKEFSKEYARIQNGGKPDSALGQRIVLSMKHEENLEKIKEKYKSLPGDENLNRIKCRNEIIEETRRFLEEIKDLCGKR